MRHRFARVLRFLLIALFLAELGYVVGANAVLNLGGIQKALASTEDIQVKSGRIWTIWPGRLHVKDLRILFQDHNLLWSLDAPSVVIDVAFLPFLSKTFHATRVRGEGLVFRMRHRVLAADANLPRTRALPPIPEFPTPALIPAYVPPPPRTDLWRIHVEDVDVGVVEIWAEQFRYRGAGGARGAFRLHAGQNLWVGPATLYLEPGQLEAGGRVLSPRFGGEVGCVVHPFNVHIPSRETLRYISASVDLHGEDVRLEPLDLFLPLGTTLSAPGSRLDVVAATDRGVFTGASYAALGGPELAVQHRGWGFGSGAFEVGARGLADGTGEATARIEHGRAFQSGHPKTRLALGPTKVGAVSSSRDTSVDWEILRVDFAVSKLEVPELRGFDALAKPHGLRLDGGSVLADAKGYYSEGVVSGEGRAVVSSGRGRVRALGWELDGRARVTLGRVETEALAGGSAELDLSARRLAVSASSTRIEAKDAHVTARARMSQERGSGRVRVAARELSLRRGSLRVASRAQVDVDVSRFNLRQGTARGTTSGELAAFEATSGPAFRARAKQVRLSSDLSLGEGALSEGWLAVSTPELRLRAGDTSLSAEARLRVDANDLDLAARRGGASSLVVLRELSVVDAVHGAKCQRATAGRAAIRAKLGFSPTGSLGLDVSGSLERAHARWDDFLVSGDARFETRYRQGTSDRIALDLDTTKLHLKSGTGKLEGWEADIPELHVAGALLRRRDGRLHGTVRAEAKQAVGRIGKTPVHGDLKSDWKLDVVDLKRAEAIGSGNLRIDHAGLVAGGTKIENWWGRVDIPTVRWTVRDNVDLSGDFSAKFRDGLPALSIFAASGDVPGWVPTLLPLEELEAQGEFRRHCRTADIVFARVTGGPLAAAGRLQSVPSDTRSAFLIQLRSPVRVATGIVSYDDKVAVAVFAGNDWLSEQSKTLDDWALLGPCKAPPDSGCESDSPEERAR